MKERPILMSAPMVRAILADTKSQTRRLVKLPPWASIDQLAHAVNVQRLPGVALYKDGRPQRMFDPYVPGNRLRVRETWRTEELPDCTDGIRFAADDAFVPIENTSDAADQWVIAHDNGKHGQKWRPSIFLPTWASRIRLEITDVRVERLQDISGEDAKAEGVEDCDERDHSDCFYGLSLQGYKCAYQRLWNEINGPGSWNANPWVWKVCFRSVQP